MAEESYQGQFSVQQDMPKKVPNPYEKRQKITMAIIVVAMILGAIYLFWEDFIGARPDVKIDGTKISMRSTVQDLLDAGFVLCSIDGKISNNGDASIKGKEIYNIDYYIGVPIEFSSAYCESSGVKITLANFDSSTKQLKDCAIYQMGYYPSLQKNSVEVLIGGENLKDANLDEWMDFFEKAEYPFKKTEMDEVRRGDRGLLLETKGRYKFEADIDYEHVDGTTKYYLYSLIYTRNIDVTYK